MAGHRAAASALGPRARVLVLFLVACAPTPRAVAAPGSSALVTLPGARYGHAAVALPGGVLAFGGYRPGVDSRASATTLWLAAGADAWQRRAAMASPRSFHAGGAVAGLAYAVGPGLEVYDPARDRWRVVVPPDVDLLPRSHLAAGALGSTVYVLGGMPLERSGFFAVDVDAVDAVDAAAARPAAVRAVAPPPGFAAGDHLHLMAALGGELHVVGGLDHATSTPQREHHVFDGRGWRTLPPPPVGMWRKFAAAAVAGGRWFVFGEFGGHCYDARTGRWSSVAPLDTMVVLPAAVTVGPAIWLVGGRIVDAGAAGRLLRRYDLAADRWGPWR